MFQTARRLLFGQFAKAWFSSRSRELAALNKASNTSAGVFLLVILLAASSGTASAAVIPVKILVDDEERTTRQAWQVRLKQRLDNASDIINQYADIRFSVVEFGTWNSDRRINDLNRSLREFEQEVAPGRARIAIGFSSQYKFGRGINGLGGTRGPLHTHILLRESSPKTHEPERLEALVHELGHFLGAAHSQDNNSVMRPVIGDGRARSRTFRIGFDPLNARVLTLIGRDINSLGVERFSGLSPRTRERVLQQYHQLSRELPRDPTAKRFIKFLEQVDKRDR